MKNIHQDDVCIVTRTDTDPNRYYGTGTKSNISVVLLKFQEGSPEISQNGFTLENVIAACADRLDVFNQGNFKCDFNDRALAHLQAALKELEDRVIDRKERGVYDTLKS